RAGKGIMPSFSPDRITDKELAGLVVFIRNWYSP
ncbi:MAG: cytochrome c, partial [Chloroflexi bacterium]|nr:cytochrome c [Chloroflexota bacterium]